MAIAFRILRDTDRADTSERGNRPMTAVALARYGATRSEIDALLRPHIAGEDLPEGAQRVHVGVRAFPR